MDFDKIHQYIDLFSTDEDPILSELNRETHQKVINPRMLSGKLQGHLLHFISQMLKPQYILEVGTFTGYATICLARGLAKGGELHTIECNDEVLPYAQKYFERTGMSNCIKQHIGNALNILPKLNYQWDLVFLDADKKQYVELFEIIIKQIKPGGFILADNVLWNGKVLNNIAPKDIEANAIHQFNQYIATDKRVENVILPLRDGISLIRKL